MIQKFTSYLAHLQYNDSEIYSKCQDGYIFAISAISGALAFLLLLYGKNHIADFYYCPGIRNNLV